MKVSRGGKSGKDPSPQQTSARTSDDPRLYEAQQRIKNLEEQIATMNEGQNVSRADYDKLESRLRSEQDDHIQVIRAYRELQSRFEEVSRKKAELQERVTQFKEQKKTRLRGAEDKDSKIAELQLEVQRYEAMTVKNRQDYIQYLADKKKLVDGNKRYESHIADLDHALIEMTNRNKELAKALQETQQENEYLQLEIQNQKKYSAQLENEVSRAKSDYRSRRGRDSEMRLDAAETNFADAKQKLILANNMINEMKIRIEALEREEKRAAKLQIALDQRNSQIRDLQENLDQCEMELQSYRGSAEEYRIQIEEARDRLQLTIENAENHINAMKAEVEYYRKRTEKEFKKNADLEEQVRKSEEELKATKHQLDEFMSERYGLTEAVNEMRQLKTMVSVRDAQIADLVMENGWYQKVISELEAILPKSFDFQGFYDKIDKQQTDAEYNVMERKAVDLLQKTLAAHKNAPVGQVKIILGADKRKKKTIVMTNNAEGELKIVDSSLVLDRSVPSQKAIQEEAPPQEIPIPEEIPQTNVLTDTDSTTSTDDDSSSFNENSFSLVESSQIIGRKRKERQLKRQKRKEQEMSSAMGSTRESLQDFHVSHVAAVTIDSGCQVGEGLAIPLFAEPIVQERPDEDEWLRDLRAILETVKKENLNLKKENGAQKDELAARQQELSAVKARLEEMRAEIDRLKAELRERGSTRKRPIMSPIQVSNDFSSSSDDGKPSPKLSPRSPQRRMTNDPLAFDNDDDVELARRMVPKAKLSISVTSSAFEAIVKRHLEFYHSERDEVIMPSEAEREVFEARNDAYRLECEQLQKVVSERQHDLEDLKAKLDQRDQIIQEMHKTIENLEQKLAEQREAFHEKIIEMNNSAERILESRLKEARDMDALMNARMVASGPTEDELAEVSRRIQQLNHDKDQLEGDLREAKETMRFMQRQNDQLQHQVRLLEMDKAQLQERTGFSSSRHQELKDYLSGLKMKYTALQKKYQDLQRIHEDLKRQKGARNDPLMMSGISHGSDKSGEGSARGEDASAAAKLKTVIVKNEQLRTQNEEMQLRLSKAQSTIERLNQLVQRKETQLTTLQEQVAKYKNTRPSGPPSARSRR